MKKTQMEVNRLNNYEGIFIVKPSLTDETSKKVLGQIEGEISRNGGTIENLENWGKKALAYSVKKNKEGMYYKVDFKIEPGKVTELNNTYRLNEDILKVMIIKK